jgi:type IV secretory pathway VirB9-like protein
VEYCPGSLWQRRAEQTTPIIVLKPQLAGLDTNLLITTDQSTQKWQEQLAEQRQRERETKNHSDVFPAMIAVEKKNFDLQSDGTQRTPSPGARL